MINITIGNYWGEVYSEELKKNGIKFLLEIDGNTNFTFTEEEFKKADTVMTEARNKHKALLYAERHGIIEYHTEGNKMVYYSSFPMEHSTVKAVVNLDLMTEKREYLPEYYVAYTDLIDGKYRANYCA